MEYYVIYYRSLKLVHIAFKYERTKCCYENI